MSKKKIIITGASGYIGSCLYNFLKKKYQIFLIDKIKPKKLNKLPVKLFFLCNLINKKKLDLIFKKINPDIVIHLAARSTVNENISIKNYYLNNVIATKNLVDVMKKNLVKKIIFSSTAAVYKEKSNKISEKNILSPISKYGKTKLLTEKILLKEKKINTIIFRFFNVCSALTKPLVGEFHQPETHLIPKCISAAAKNRIISIFGNNYPTEDGTCIRDYIHIFDVCSAIEKGILFINKKTNCKEIFNLGNGKGFSINQVINKLAKILKKKLKIIFLKRRKGDVPFLVCNIRKAKNKLKWSPKKSKLKDILLDDIIWNNFLLKKKFFR